MHETSVNAIIDRARTLYKKPAYAVFDADGTLWAFDVGNRLFAHVLTERAFKEAAKPPLVAALSASGLAATGDACDCYVQLMQAYERGEADEAIVYRAMTQALAGFSLAGLDAAHARAMAETPPIAAQVFAEIRTLFIELRAIGFRIAVVSASPVWTVRFALAAAGLQADDIRGAECDIDNGIVTDKLIEPFTYREGKLAVIERDFGRAPTIGFGDSRGDAPFLSACELAVLVNPRPALRVLAKDFKEAVVLRCPRTEGGLVVASPERDQTVD